MGYVIIVLLLYRTLATYSAISDIAAPFTELQIRIKTAKRKGSHSILAVSK